MSSLSRRAVGKGLFLGLPLATLGLSQASAFTGSLPVKKYLTEDISDNARDIRVSIAFNPSAKPTGGDWYQHLRFREDTATNTYINGVIYSKGFSELALQIEYIIRGSKRTVAYQSVPARLANETFSVYFTVAGDEAKLTLWQRNQQTVRLVASGAAVFTGLKASRAVWMGNTNAIDFREQFNVESLVGGAASQITDTSAGRLDYPGFKLRLNEEFNGPLDSRYWNVRDSGNWLTTGVTGPGAANWPSINNQSLAIDTKDNVDISNGTCKIWLRKIENPRLSPYSWGYTAGKKFTHTTGYIDTEGKVEGHFLRFEFRAKMPFSAQRAVWGGGWLMNNKSYARVNNQWVLNGDNYYEIDLGEGYGKNEAGKTTFDASDRVESTVHFAEVGTALAKDPAHQKKAAFSPHEPGLENEWHIWAVEVTPKGIEFFYDNNSKPYHAVYAKDHPVLAARLADKDQLLSIRMNLMTGNPYWNTTDTNEEIAKSLELDYVRFWDYVG